MLTHSNDVQGCLRRLDAVFNYHYLHSVRLVLYCIPGLCGSIAAVLRPEERADKCNSYVEPVREYTCSDTGNEVACIKALEISER